MSGGFLRVALRALKCLFTKEEVKGERRNVAPQRNLPGSREKAAAGSDKSSGNCGKWSQPTGPREGVGWSEGRWCLSRHQCQSRWSEAVAASRWSCQLGSHLA